MSWIIYPMFFNAGLALFLLGLIFILIFASQAPFDTSKQVTVGMAVLLFGVIIMLCSMVDWATF